MHEETAQLTEQFVQALGQLELERELDPIVGCYAGDCVISNALTKKEFKGVEGARDFWGEYRNHFDDMRSTFRNTIVDENRSALEWVTEGSLSRGDRISYEGVSVLEFAGGKISRFYAYFDPTKLGTATRVE